MMNLGKLPGLGIILSGLVTSSISTGQWWILRVDLGSMRVYSPRRQSLHQSMWWTCTALTADSEFHVLRVWMKLWGMWAWDYYQCLCFKKIWPTGLTLEESGNEEIVRMHITIAKVKGQSFFVKGQIVNICKLAVHVVSITNT